MPMKRPEALGRKTQRLEKRLDFPRIAADYRLDVLHQNLASIFITAILVLKIDAAAESHKIRTGGVPPYHSQDAHRLSNLHKNFLI